MKKVQLNRKTEHKDTKKIKRKKKHEDIDILDVNVPDYKRRIKYTLKHILTKYKNNYKSFGKETEWVLTVN